MGYGARKPGSNRASNGVLSNCSFCEGKASFANQFFTAPPPLGSTRILDDVAIFLEKTRSVFHSHVSSSNVAGILEEMLRS